MSGFTQEQQELRALVRDFGARHSTSAAVRELAQDRSPGDPAVWRQLTGQLGLAAIPIPESYGGAGYGAVELGVVLEEMGRVLFVSPYYATVVLAAQTLLAVDDEDARQRWLPAIAEGSLTATLALAEQDGRWDPAAVMTSAEQDGERWALTGTKWFVPDGCSAQLLLVVARTAEGPGLFAVDADAPGLVRTSLDPLDLTRDLARLDLTGVPATAIGAGTDVTTALSRALDAIHAATAAEQIGGAGRCLDMAVEYAGVREQFGRPIGSFQAIKHKCTAMLLDVEAGRSASWFASEAVAADAADAPAAVAVAKAACSQAFTHAAKENIQIHGGIGYTWEHDAHLYLRRAKTAELLFGAPSVHRARLAALVGISA